MVTNKDILLGLVGTLTDNECRDIIYFITDKEYDTANIIQFDLVHITKNQYSKLIWLWGKEKTHECIEILNEWLNKKKINKKISHYKQLVGWVERKYYQLNGVGDKSIQHTGSVDTKWKAIQYIKKIPKELRCWDSQVRFLVDKFNIDIGEIK